MMNSEILMSLIKENCAMLGQRAEKQQSTAAQGGRNKSAQVASTFKPYQGTNKDTTYFNWYDVFLPVSSSGCGLQFSTSQYPYVENYYITFDKYTRENDDISELEEKSLVFGSGNVLLAVDGLHIGGEKLQCVNYKILMKCNRTINLTFLNKYWLNSRDRKSVKVQQNTVQSEYVEKCVFYVVVYCILYST
jgi:hypothetical protein